MIFPAICLGRQLDLFCSQHKENLQFIIMREDEPPGERYQNILKDEIIELTGRKTGNKYPKKLRRVAISDENKQVIELITDQKTWEANTISKLYKSRWQIEMYSER